MKKKTRKSPLDNPSHSGPLAGVPMRVLFPPSDTPFPVRLWVFTTPPASGELTHWPETSDIRPSYPLCGPSQTCSILGGPGLAVRIGSYLSSAKAGHAEEGSSRL